MVGMSIINKTKSYYKLFAVFISIEIILFMLLSIHKQEKVDEYLNDMTGTIKNEYLIILDSFTQKAEIAFETLINTPKTKTLVKKLLDAPEAEKRIYRKELYQSLLPKYEELKQYGFKQVQFHTPDNHSLLRMHAPDKFGDDLSRFRHTVVYVNDTMQKTSSFEEGLAYDGYRFVFPLFFQSKYLGSVELSFPTLALANFLNKEFMHTKFIISKDALLPNNLSAYIPSIIAPGFVTQKDYDTLQAYFPDKTFLNETFLKNNKKSFSIESKIDNQRFIATFIPVIHTLTEKTDAYMIIFSKNKYLDQLDENFRIVFSVLSSIVFLLFFYILREKKLQHKIEQQNQNLLKNNQKLKTIINVQDNMIVITNDDHITDVNSKVLHFFGYSTLDHLLRDHQCICDFFLRHEEYFHMGKVPKQRNWIEYFLNLPQKQKIVTMVGVDMEPKAFQVNISQYDNEGNAIITFTDITEMIIREKILQYKAQHDRLTDIYNRQKIDEILEKTCGYTRRRKEQIGVIMFDIDHFKTINDTYGHATGDKVLKTLAQTIKKHIREDDIFGRWGGEEFIIILRHASAENSFKKAEQLRQVIEDISRTDIPKITASFGVTEIVANDTPESVLKRVDIALYKAKAKGRNCVVLSTIKKSKLVLTNSC